MKIGPMNINLMNTTREIDSIIQMYWDMIERAPTAKELAEALAMPAKQGDAIAEQTETPQQAHRRKAGALGGRRRPLKSQRED